LSVCFYDGYDGYDGCCVCYVCCVCYACVFRNFFSFLKQQMREDAKITQLLGFYS
jgi:hypothetical protein